MPGGEVVPHRLRQLGAAHADGAVAAAVRLPEGERAGEEEVAAGAFGVEKEAFPVHGENKALAAVRGERHAAVRAVAALDGVQLGAAREAEAAVAAEREHGAEPGAGGVAFAEVGVPYAGGLRRALQRGAQDKGVAVGERAAAARLRVIAQLVGALGDERQIALALLQQVAPAAIRGERHRCAVHVVEPVRAGLALAPEVEAEAAVVAQREHGHVRAVFHDVDAGREAVRLSLRAGEGAGGGKGDEQQHGGQGDGRVFRFFHDHINPFPDVPFASCHCRGGAQQVAGAAGGGDKAHQREAVAVALALAQARDGPFVAGELAVAARRRRAQPDDGVPPVERQAEPAQQRPYMVAAAVVRRLVRQDMPPGFPVTGHRRREIDGRARQAEDAGRAQALRGVDVQALVPEEEFPPPAQRAGAGEVYEQEPSAHTDRPRRPGGFERLPHAPGGRAMRIGAHGRGRATFRGRFADGGRAFKGRGRPAGGRGGGCRRLCAAFRRRGQRGGGYIDVGRCLRRRGRRLGQGVHQRERAWHQRYGQQQPQQRQRPERAAEAAGEMLFKHRAHGQQQQNERRAGDGGLNHRRPPPLPPAAGWRPARLSPRG